MSTVVFTLEPACPGLCQRCGIMIWLQVLARTLTGAPELTVECQKQNDDRREVVANFAGLGLDEEELDIRRHIAREIGQELTWLFPERDILVMFAA